jgi:hypothetical protein
MASDPDGGDDKRRATAAIRRRGVFAAGGALLALFLGRATERTAEANSDGQPLLIGSSSNTETGETDLTRTATSQNQFAFYAVNNGYTCIVGQTNSIGYGVAGVANNVNATCGVLGKSFVSAIGVYGVLGMSDYTGVFGQSTGTGSVAGYGVAGSSAGNAGVYATTSSPSSYALIASHASGRTGLGANITGAVLVDGNFAVSGTKAAIVPHPDGFHRRLYCLESPESYFEDFGKGRVVRGQGTVRLDPEFAALVHSDDYQVFLTPEGDSKGLYVSGKSPTSFDVREQQGGISTLHFSYRVVAKRKDVLATRLEKVMPPPPPAEPPRHDTTPYLRGIVR